MNSLTRTPKLLDDKALGSDLPFLQSRRRRRGLGGLEELGHATPYQTLTLQKRGFPPKPLPPGKRWPVRTSLPSSRTSRICPRLFPFDTSQHTRTERHSLLTTARNSCLQMLGFMRNDFLVRHKVKALRPPCPLLRTVLSCHAGVSITWTLETQ